MNVPVKQKQTHRHREQTCGYQGGGWVEEDWIGSLGWPIQLLYTQLINDKVLLWRTGNYIQYPIINHNGKEYEKEYKNF